MALVKALKSFEFQGSIMHPWAEPFEIRDNDVVQFLALKLVEQCEVTDTAEPGNPAEQVQEPARRGRKPNHK